MATIPRRPFVVTPAEELAFNLPPQVTIALAQIGGAVKKGLLSLCVGAGLAVVNEIMEAEVTVWGAFIQSLFTGLDLVRKIDGWSTALDRQKV